MAVLEMLSSLSEPLHTAGLWLSQARRWLWGHLNSNPPWSVVPEQEHQSITGLGQVNLIYQVSACRLGNDCFSLEVRGSCVLGHPGRMSLCH